MVVKGLGTLRLAQQVAAKDCRINFDQRIACNILLLLESIGIRTSYSNFESSPRCSGIVGQENESW